jgi:hypothetical protein
LAFPDLGRVNSLPNETKRTLPRRSPNALFSQEWYSMTFIPYVSLVKSYLGKNRSFAPNVGGLGQIWRQGSALTRVAAGPPAPRIRRRRRPNQRSGRPKVTGGTGSVFSTGALEPCDAPAPGVVVLIPILIGGTCMQLSHRTFLLSHPLRVRVLIWQTGNAGEFGVMA